MDSWVQAESGLTLTSVGLADSDSDSDPLDSASDSDSDSGPMDLDSHLMDSDSDLMDSDSDSDSDLVDSDSLPDSRVWTHSNTAWSLFHANLISSVLTKQYHKCSQTCYFLTQHHLKIWNTPKPKNSTFFWPKMSKKFSLIFGTPSYVKRYYMKQP